MMIQDSDLRCNDDCSSLLSGNGVCIYSPAFCACVGGEGEEGGTL